MTAEKLPVAPDRRAHDDPAEHERGSRRATDASGPALVTGQRQRLRVLGRRRALRAIGDAGDRGRATSRGSPWSRPAASATRARAGRRIRAGANADPELKPSPTTTVPAGHVAVAVCASKPGEPHGARRDTRHRAAIAIGDRAEMASRADGLALPRHRPAGRPRCGACSWGRRWRGRSSSAAARTRRSPRRTRRARPSGTSR